MFLTTFFLVLLLVPYLAESSVLLVVGGSQTILLDRQGTHSLKLDLKSRQRESPVLNFAELVGCPGGPLRLPDYPRQLKCPLCPLVSQEGAWPLLGLAGWERESDGLWGYWMAAGGVGAVLVNVLNFLSFLIRTLCVLVRKT